MARARNFCLVVCFFVCPLIFFTNLTRNPYVTQISLLNIFLLAAGALLAVERAFGPEAPALAKTALDLPLWSWAAACLLSWSAAYLRCDASLKPAVVNEGLRNFLFLLANTLVPFYLAVSSWRESQDNSQVSVGGWTFLVIGWGLLWTLFSQMRGPGAGPADFWGNLWDPYGALLWAAGLGGALWLCRKSRWTDYLHLALAVGTLASIYAVLQYFNLDPIWPHALNPYGSRSVSTFGNPNFMSSYNVVLLPFAAIFFSQSKGPRRFAYGTAFLLLETALLCSMTRSSWAGAAVALSVLALSGAWRKAVIEDPKPHGLLLAAAAAIAAVWPAGSFAKYAPSVIGRLSEFAQSVGAHRGVYAPLHQRLLIWTCAWQMGRQSPLLGKGWGLFELFYPFYQGPILNSVAAFNSLRTHANNAHNELLETFSQTGLLGTGVLLWLWAVFARSVKPQFQSSQAKSAWLAAAAAGVAGMLADNLLNVSLHFAVPALIFWWMAGTAMAQPAAQAPRAPGPKPSVSLQIAALGFCALALPASWYWVKSWNRETHYFAGFKLERAGAFDDAVRELEASRAWGPPEVNALYELGNAYARVERYADAAKTYGEALDANAGYDEIFFNRGSIETLHLGATDKAIPDFITSLWINPLSHPLYDSLGNIYLRNLDRDQAQAIGLFEQGVRLFPREAAYWNDLGYLHTRLRQWDKAERDYSRALEDDPNLVIAARNLEVLSRQAGRPRPAILKALATLSALQSRLAQGSVSEEDEASAKRIAAQFPDMTVAHFLLGRVELARGRTQDALEQFRQAQALEPDNAEILKFIEQIQSRLPAR